jgi:hypothetical protein
MISRAESGMASHRRSPTTRCPGASIPLHRQPIMPGLPSGQRVVALDEADGMTPPTPPQPRVRLGTYFSPSWRSAGVRGAERPQLVPAEPSVRLGARCEPAI